MTPPEPQSSHAPAHRALTVCDVVTALNLWEIQPVVGLIASGVQIGGTVGPLGVVLRATWAGRTVETLPAARLDGTLVSELLARLGPAAATGHAGIRH